MAKFQIDWHNVDSYTQDELEYFSGSHNVALPLISPSMLSLQELGHASQVWSWQFALNSRWKKESAMATGGLDGTVFEDMLQERNWGVVHLAMGQINASDESN